MEQKYKTLANQLTQDIFGGRYHRKIPGMRVLAKDYDVHLTTISKAVNTLVDKGVLYTERGVGTFINNEIVEKRQLMIWLVARKWSEEFTTTLRNELLGGLKEGFDEYNFEEEFRMVEIEAIKKGSWKESFSKETFQGVVTTGITLEHKDDVRTLVEEGIPCVSLLFREKGVNFVDADNVGGAYEAVKHLVSLGHRNIAFISGNLHAPNMRDNLIGYKKALVENGVEYKRGLVSELESIRVEDMTRATREMIRENPGVTAIFTSGDTIAVEAITTLKNLGLKVPRDVSVVGFDDLPMGRYCHPSLTTVRQPFYDVGKLAARRLIELIEGKVKRVQDILPTELLIRESTASRRKQKNERR